ncbi:UNVERIFIED_ORG: hypothetical protein C7430_12210 [Pantoea agglomerans]|uniref:Uncharacterized protein n=1 Tax=Enterobacter agglomerans TaxID=549 RepID=A0ABD6XKX0_ENTAG
MTRLKVPLHGGHRVPHEPERHMPVRGGLLLDKNMYVPIACTSFQAAECVTEILPVVVLNERTEFQLQCT